MSVRVSIANYENLLSSALKRAIRLGESVAVPRVSDLGALAPSTGGKIELETVGDGGEEKILVRLRAEGGAERLQPLFGGAELAEVVKGFEGGVAVQTADSMPSEEYVQQVGPDAGAARGRRQARRHRAGRRGRRGRVRARGPAPDEEAQQGHPGGPLRYRV